MSFERIILDSPGSDEIGRITINTPGNMNALGKQTRSEMIAVLKEVKGNKKIRCLIVRGAGERAFSAGEDLRESMRLGPSSVKRWVRGWNSFFLQIMRLPQPIVTSCSGYAVGAGWQVYLLGDYRISSERARFAMSEVDVGLPPIIGATILTSMIGPSQLSRFTMMCDTIDADEALKLGLVHEVVSLAALESSTHAAAKKLAGKPATAIQLQRRWLQGRLLRNYREGVAGASSIYGRAFASGEPRAGIGSFFEKKKTIQE